MHRHYMCVAHTFGHDMITEYTFHLQEVPPGLIFGCDNRTVYYMACVRCSH